MSDDNIFDEDDALDYIIYEEMENDAGMGGGRGKGSCLASMLLLAASGTVFCFLLCRFFV